MTTRLEDYDNAPEISGTIAYEEDWYLLLIPSEVQEELLELLEKWPEPFKPVKKPHISVIKNEAPSLNKEDWGTAFVDEEVKVRYCPAIRHENGLHLWVDCHSPRLCQIREHFAVPTLRRAGGPYLVNFHLTLARRKKAMKPQLRPQIRITPSTHIDVETGMQHL